MAAVVTRIGEAENPGEPAPDRLAGGVPGADADSLFEHPRARYKDVQANKKVDLIEMPQGCLLRAISQLLTPAVKRARFYLLKQCAENSEHRITGIAGRRRASRDLIMRTLDFIVRPHLRAGGLIMDAGLPDIESSGRSAVPA